MVWLALPPHAGDKPWMGCGGDGAVGIGIGAGILLWGAMGGWWGVRVGDGVRFLLFYSGLALTCPWRGVLWALLGRGGVVGWAGNFGWALLGTFLFLSLDLKSEVVRQLVRNSYIPCL